MIPTNPNLNLSNEVAEQFPSLGFDTPPPPNLPNKKKRSKAVSGAESVQYHGFLLEQKNSFLA